MAESLTAKLGIRLRTVFQLLEIEYCLFRGHISEEKRKCCDGIVEFMFSGVSLFKLKMGYGGDDI